MIAKPKKMQWIVSQDETIQVKLVATQKWLVVEVENGFQVEKDFVCLLLTFEKFHEFFYIYQEFPTAKEDIKKYFKEQYMCKHRSLHMSSNKQLEEIRKCIEYFSDDDLNKLANKLGYNGYISSSYWTNVSKYYRNSRGNVCELCGKKGKLNVHHNSYKHFGSELRHPEDMIVVCIDCHKKIHVKKNENANKRAEVWKRKKEKQQKKREKREAAKHKTI